MNKSIVILQPQYFPWVGVFEQIKLADVYVHYDDVQYPQGRSFTNRVQLKTNKGQQWITVPTKGNGLCMINEKIIDDSQNWSRKHKDFFKQCYSSATFIKDALEIMDDVFGQKYQKISDLNIYALEKISAYFGLKTEFVRSSEIGIEGHSTERLVDICNKFDAKIYITGLGARNYVNYDVLENANIKLQYMQYEKIPYPQLHGEFIPFVSILDLIANCGKDGVNNIYSKSKYWRDIPNLSEM